MDPGVAEYTELPTYTSDKRIVYSLMEVRTDIHQITRLEYLIKSLRTETTPGMMRSHSNIKRNLDIINNLLGYNSTIPFDVPTIKNALLSNQQQIRELVKQVTIAALSESTQAVKTYLITGNSSKILNHIQGQLKTFMKGKEPDETIIVAILTWMGIITILTLTLWVVAIRNKKKCKSHYSLCHQETKPGAIMTAYSKTLHRRPTRPTGNSKISRMLLPK